MGQRREIGLDPIAPGADAAARGRRKLAFDEKLGHQGLATVTGGVIVAGLFQQQRGRQSIGQQPHEPARVALGLGRVGADMGDGLETILIRGVDA